MEQDLFSEILLLSLLHLTYFTISTMEALRSELNGRRLLIPQIDTIFTILRRELADDSWVSSNILTVEQYDPNILLPPVPVFSVVSPVSVNVTSPEPVMLAPSPSPLYDLSDISDKELPMLEDSKFKPRTSLQDSSRRLVNLIGAQRYQTNSSSDYSQVRKPVLVLCLLERIN